MRTLLFALLCLPRLLAAQPTITICENFSIGMVMRFQNCDTNVFTGNGGANQTWNFSTLSNLPAIDTQWIVSPASTTHASLFPAANIVEKNSMGTFVYSNNSIDSNHMVGFLDTTSGLTIIYRDPMLFLFRPIHYGDIDTNIFTDTFSSGGYDFRGSGISIIHADGYGTLLLPNGTYNNVLRVKITHMEDDTLVNFSTPGTSTTVTYAWFDSSHSSALLKIDSTNVPGFYYNKSVKYLLQDSTSAVGKNNIEKRFQLYPNPVSEQFTFSANDKGELIISDQFGRVIKTVSINEYKTNISTHNLAPGIYYVTFQTEKYRQSTKLFVQY